MQLHVDRLRAEKLERGASEATSPAGATAALDALIQAERSAEAALADGRAVTESETGPAARLREIGAELARLG
jgi:hypothetical protein